MSIYVVYGCLWMLIRLYEWQSFCGCLCVSIDIHRCLWVYFRKFLKILESNRGLFIVRYRNYLEFPENVVA